MKKALVVMIAFVFAIGFAMTGCGGKKDAPAEPTPTPGPMLVDDMEDGDNRSNSVDFGGYWFTYDDLASPNNGTSNVWPGSQTAADKYLYPTPLPTFEMTVPGMTDSPAYCARVSGVVTSSFQYGFLGMGVDLKGDAVSGPGKIAMDLYASGFKALRFWAKSGPNETRAAKNWKVKLTTTYAGMSDGDDQPLKAFTVTNDWQQFTIPLGEFTQEGWGTAQTNANMLTSVIQIQFQTPGANVIGTGTIVDLMVDKIEFTR